MGPRILDLRGDAPPQGILSEVTEHLVEGGLIAMPTETVYGFGCLARREPLRRLRELKARGPAKPFLLLIQRSSIIFRASLAFISDLPGQIIPIVDGLVLLPHAS